MDGRTENWADEPRLHTLLMDLYNYFRMDSSTDPIILFEQLCFVLAQLREELFPPEDPAEMKEGMYQYRRLIDSFSDTALGRRIKSAPAELSERPELVFRLMSAAHEAVRCEQKQTARLGPVLSRFLEQLFQSRSAGIVCTPLDTAWELVSLLFPERYPLLPYRILDPACGSGAFLIALAERSRSEGWEPPVQVKVTGLERDEHLRRCAILLLHFYGVSEDFARVEDGGFPPRVERVRYDLVLANPPFRTLSLRDQGTADSDDYDLPVRTKDVHHKFLQKSLLGLVPGGTCALIVPDSFLNNTVGSARAVRKWMLENYRLEAVIKLPAYTFYPQGVVNASVLVLSRPRYLSGIDDENRQIFFYEVESDGKTNDARRLPDDRNDFTELRQIWSDRDSLRADWESWAAERRQYGAGRAGKWGNPRFWFGALEDIQRSDYSLLPGQYRPLGPLDDQAVQDPEEILKELRALCQDMEELVDKLSEAEHEYRRNYMD